MMDALVTVFIYAILSQSHGVPMSPYHTIVIGLGASGSSAAGTLAAAGKKVLALEAQNRIGGRVNTVPFGDGVVELGAEWIHGTHPSSVYDLAMKHNISILPQDLTFKVYRSDGSSKYNEVVNDLILYCLNVVEKPPETPEPLGEFITKKVREYIKTNHSEVANDTEFIDNFLQFMDLVIDNYESSNSWNEVSTDTKYEDLEGHLHLSWHTHGYKTLFEILLNTYNNGPGYPNLDIKLNTEVTKIEWPQNPEQNVIVTVKDGTKFTAKYVIVTVSLGVLKATYSTLFSPQIPIAKETAINAISVGLLDKVELHFSEPWWDHQGEIFVFFWDTEKKASIKDGDKWMTSVVMVSNPMGSGDVLTVWLSGDRAKLVETLPEDVVKTKVMEVIRKFMGKNTTIPEPIGILRSAWFSDPFTRGSYSFDNVLTPQHPTARSDLARPLVDSDGNPRVLFAGEATDNTHFSTVHGAVDTGRREAARLLRTPSKI